MNLHYRSSIVAILQIPCCTRPYICYVMDKQSRYGNKPRFTKINNSMDKTVTKEKKKVKSETCNKNKHNINNTRIQCNNKWVKNK